MRQRRRLARIRERSLPSLAVLLWMAAAGACDESFQPTEPGELQYSVFGYLDASVDTQWIRVMPIRPLVTSPPGPLSARVTLEHLGTGRVVEMRDSVFEFAINPELGAEGVPLHNFWTTERIEPGAPYRLSIRGEDGGSAETIVEVPPDYQIEVWRRQAQSTQGDLLNLIGLEHVALVGTITRFRDGCGVGVDRAAFTFTLVESTLHRVPGAPLPQIRPGCGDPRPFAVELWVAGSGAPWPKGQDYLGSRLNVPDALSAISGSVGFVGGVLTRTVPLEACQMVVPAGPNRDHCKLRYDGSTATLSGTLTDATCGGPIEGANVVLREIDPGLPTPYRVRSTGSDAEGGFKIGALQAGPRHVLSVRQFVAGADRFTEFFDTLRFSPGEQVTRDVALRRVEPCPA